MTREELLERIGMEYSREMSKPGGHFSFNPVEKYIDATLKVIRAEVNRMYVNDQEFGNAAGWNGALDKINNQLITLLALRSPQDTKGE